MVGFSMELDAGSVLPKMIAHARHRGFGAILAICSLVTASAGFAADNTPVGNCGLSPSDWCQSPPADPCGVHKDAVSCDCHILEHEDNDMMRPFTVTA